MLSWPTSCGSFEPVDHEVGDCGRGVVGDEVRCVVGDGLLLHRLTVDPELDMRPAIERAVRALAES